MGWGMVLGEIVAQVFGAWFPKNVEVFLYHAIADPVVAHIYGARALAADGVVHDAICCRLVGGDWCGWLWEAHFCEGGVDNFPFFGVNKEGSDFCFGCGGGDVLQDTGGV